MKKIAIFKEHHGSIVLDWSTPEQQEKAALSVVLGRFSGDHDYYPMEEPTKPTDLDFTAEQVDSWPLSLQAEARKKLEKHNEAVSYYQRQLRVQANLKRCIETKDGKLALRIVNSRSYNIDEGFEVHEVYDEYPRFNQ